MKLGRVMVKRFGGGGAGFSKVYLSELKINFVASLANLQTVLDPLSVTVQAGQVCFFQVWHYANNVDGEVSLAKYALKNDKVSVVYNPANPIKVADLIYLGESSITEILAGQGVQIFEFSEMGSVTPAEFGNLTGDEYDIQNQNIGNVVFRGTRNGSFFYWLFQNVGGTYGQSAGGIPFADTDFVPLSGDIPSLETVLMVGNRRVKFVSDYPYIVEIEDKSTALENGTDGSDTPVILFQKGGFQSGDEVQYHNYNGGITGIPAAIHTAELVQIFFNGFWSPGTGGDTGFKIQIGSRAFFKLIYAAQSEVESDQWIMTIESGFSEPRRLSGLIAQDAPSTATEGELKIGAKYTITNYLAGDDFENVGGTNIEGESFIATGKIPTNWANGSQLDYNGAPYFPAIFQNTLGFMPSAYRSAPGDTAITGPAGAFPEGKATLEIQNSLYRNIGTEWIDTEQFYVRAWDSTGTWVDEIGPTKILIEIND
ncbi:MAG TPA: hypothetical protein VK528_14405 [Flavobacterium sp.]|nr:hypothetical protein [Flavobacterium sp.]